MKNKIFIVTSEDGETQLRLAALSAKEAIKRAQEYLPYYFGKEATAIRDTSGSRE